MTTTGVKTPRGTLNIARETYLRMMLGDLQPGRQHGVFFNTEDIVDKVQGVFACSREYQVRALLPAELQPAFVKLVMEEAARRRP